MFLNEKPRKIGVFTGARSEYWLLKPLISGIDRDDSLELILIVSSMHLSPEFGMTCRVIENDGFRIAEKIETLLSSDSPTGAGKAVGLGLIEHLLKIPASNHNRCLRVERIICTDNSLCSQGPAAIGKSRFNRLHQP